MNMFNMMQAMQNPQQAIVMYAVQGMMKSNPELYKQCQSMFDGKSHKAQVSELRKLYKSKGMDLDSTAKQWGISL